MCINSYCAYTGQFENEILCPYCNESRYDQKNKPRYQFVWFSLIKHLKIQYENPNRANELRYQYIYTTRNGFCEDGKIGEVFDGKCYLDLLKNGIFSR
ncbi:hypothetical protein C1646_780581 [Rhizophagus diaphanus]|nr:hypothetical protein C1646_780581 [Rhizophagus diaphanus] [Rhizophagus sp. MUCL 43196]